eukprot:scaffold20596_cov47-Attheya_sp.AAC.2
MNNNQPYTGGWALVARTPYFPDAPLLSFWHTQEVKHHLNHIIDAHVCDADSNSYLSSTPEKVLRKQELEKKKKYLQPCLDLDSCRKDFVSVDGMLAIESKELNK